MGFDVTRLLNAPWRKIEMERQREREGRRERRETDR